MPNKIQTIIDKFETEYCNNHNRKIRWLRGVFIDQEDQIREIEKFLSQAIAQTREETIREVLKITNQNLRDYIIVKQVEDFLKQSLIQLRK